ncbi:plasma membrane fusion protein prm1 [Tieghemiomyces parasiticus]|uniref:Plasma membrane fusion protein PRM1 n=1 Tax=Tieghemiomyces parasiticus TaxID=78921 RepID=A0A9W8ANB9_9FUNG|nr:plasma membrane fusion protein prm1 [Tieghemiomyces parasiticus]
MFLANHHVTRRVGKQYESVTLPNVGPAFIDLAAPSKVHSIYGHTSRQGAPDSDAPIDDREKGGPPSIFSPYLGLNAKLSRAWATYLVILILYFAIRLMLHADDVDRFSANAKDDLLRGCQNVESVGNTVLAIPRRTAEATNHMVNATALAVVDRTSQGIILAVTILEELMVFLIGMFRALQLCVADLVVQGGLALVRAGMAEFQDAFNSLMSSTIAAIRNQVDGLVTVANKVVGATANILDVFTGTDQSLPTISYPDMSSWSIEIPDSVTGAVNRTTEQVPTFNEVEQSLIDLLRKPFESLKDTIRQGFARVHVNVSLTAVPDADTLNFCQEEPTRALIDNLAKSVRTIFYIGTGVLFSVAVGLILFNMYVIQNGHRRLIAFIGTVKPWGEPSALGSRDRYTQVLDLATGVDRPWVYRWNAFVHRRCRNAERAHLVRWWSEYVVHLPSLACLGAGVVGLVVVGAQISAINQVRQTVTPDVGASLARFRTQVVNDVTGTMNRTSTEFAGRINAGLNTTESFINDDLFGPVRDGTAQLNSTLDIIINDTRDVIGKLFNDTPIGTPAMDFVNCAFIKKLEAVGSLFNYINQAANVTLPRVDPDVLVVGAESLDHALATLNAGLVGHYIGTPDDARALLANSTYAPAKQLEALGLLGMVTYQGGHNVSAAVAAWQSALTISVMEPSSFIRPTATIPLSALPTVNLLHPRELTLSPSADPGPTPRILLNPRFDFVAFLHGSAVSESIGPGAGPTVSALDESSVPTVSLATPTPTPASHSVWNPLHHHRPSSSSVSTPTPTFINRQPEVLEALAFNLRHYRNYTDGDLRRATLSGGYTGGVVGKLVDMYVQLLWSEVPLLVMLVCTWVVILTMGTVRVLGARFVWRRIWA